ncbi:MAG: hypothetical protein ACXAD7_23990 [Candidatus Kariarchaeaceae archaeon]|jgi:hypothetical protein
MSGASKKEIPEIERSELYSFWEDVQQVKIYKITSSADFNFLDNKPIRDDILLIIRRGINDPFEKWTRRHILSIQEILNELNKKRKEKKPIKTTALYYHLDTMIERGFMQKVGRILESKAPKLKKQWVNYYTRTAKAFINVHDVNKLMKHWQTIEKMINELNPDLSKREITELREDFVEIFTQSKEIPLNWLTQHHELLSKVEADAINIYDFLVLFRFIQPEFLPVVQKLVKLLKLKH